MAAGRFVALLSALLLAGCAAWALYFHIGETEKRCFIKEILDETMVISEWVRVMGGVFSPPAHRPSARQGRGGAPGAAHDMAEAQQHRVQEAVDGMMHGLEQEHICKMQGIMFQCSATCCENEHASMQQVHQRIKRCHVPLAQAQALVTQELERFQVLERASLLIQETSSVLTEEELKKLLE